MKQRTRIYYTEEQRALMWERWKKGDSLHAIGRLFDRGHSSIQPIEDIESVPYWTSTEALFAETLPKMSLNFPVVQDKLNNHGDFSFSSLAGLSLFRVFRLQRQTNHQNTRLIFV